MFWGKYTVVAGKLFLVWEWDTQRVWTILIDINSSGEVGRYPSPLLDFPLAIDHVWRAPELYAEIAVNF